jgi:hypothetical protein
MPFPLRNRWTSDFPGGAGPFRPNTVPPETNRAAQAAKRKSRISSKIVLKPGTGERQFGFSLGLHPLGAFETLDLV